MCVCLYRVRLSLFLFKVYYYFIIFHSFNAILPPNESILGRLCLSSLSLYLCPIPISLPSSLSSSGSRRTPGSLCKAHNRTEEPNSRDQILILSLILLFPNFNLHILFCCYSFVYRNPTQSGPSTDCLLVRVDCGTGVSRCLPLSKRAIEDHRHFERLKNIIKHHHLHSPTFLSCQLSGHASNAPFLIHFTYHYVTEKLLQVRPSIR